MQWLGAALAFATTMLFFAVVVSTLVEMIHRFLGLREKGLELMLESLFDRVIVPQKEKLGVEKGLTGKRFASIIMTNRAIGSADAASKGKVSSIFQYLLSASKSTNVPVEVFAQKLVDSRIGVVIDQGLDGLVQDISQKYVAFGAEATEYFRRRARLLSVLLAFPVAFLFYVHPYDLARAFVSDPALAQKIAEHQIALTYGDGSQQGETPAPGSEGQASEAAPTPEQEIARLKQDKEDLLRSISQWDELAIPVGWPDGKVMVPTLPQLFWLVVGGLLIGLGAPFWAQAVSALTASNAVSQKIASIVGGEDTSIATPSAEKEVAPAVAKATTAPTRSASVNAFKVAQKAAE